MPRLDSSIGPEEEPTASGTTSPSWTIPRIRTLLAEEQLTPTRFPLPHTTGHRMARKNAPSPLCPAMCLPLRVITTSLQPVSTGVVGSPSPVHVELLDQLAAGFGAQQLLVWRSSLRSANLSPTSPISKKAGSSTASRSETLFCFEQVAESNPASPSPVGQGSAPISRVSLLASRHTNKNDVDCRHPSLIHTPQQFVVRQSETTFFAELRHQPPHLRTVVGIVRMNIATTRPHLHKKKRKPVLSVDVPHAGGQALPH
jgi:hypothetical protein